MIGPYSGLYEQRPTVYIVRTYAGELGVGGTYSLVGYIDRYTSGLACLDAMTFAPWRLHYYVVELVPLTIDPIYCAALPVSIVT